jgi:HK97 family phage major capsid protein
MTVTTIAVVEWRGVQSDGVVVSYAAEAAETTDNSPTLAQPTISTERMQGFVPFTIKIGQDWGTLQQELFRLFADAKDTLEATKFLLGTGTAEPGGFLNRRARLLPIRRPAACSTTSATRRR